MKTFQSNNCIICGSHIATSENNPDWKICIFCEIDLETIDILKTNSFHGIVIYRWLQILGLTK